MHLMTSKPRQLLDLLPTTLTYMKKHTYYGITMESKAQGDE